jgi:uncharacterized membrane protein (DUF373 family)
MSVRDEEIAGGAPDPQDDEDARTAGGEASSARARVFRDNRWIGFLEWFDAVVYWLVGAVFLLAALLSLGYGLYAIGDQAITQMFTPTGFSPQALVKDGLGAQDIIALVSDLLLTLIIMEVLGTVVHHLQEGETTLRPFLFIGIISATRGILAVGARLSVSSNSTLGTEEFIRDMVELAVNALVIIALGIAMKLIGKFLEESAIPRRVGALRSRRGGIRSSRPVTSAPEGAVGAVVGVRTLFALMALIILVALTLIGVVLVTQGRL